MDTLLNPSDNDVALAKEMKLAISNDLRPRYSAPDKAEISILLDKCTFLIQDSILIILMIQKVPGPELQMMINIEASTSSDSTSDCASSDTGCQPPSKKRKGLGAILSKIYDVTVNSQNETPLRPRENSRG